MNRKQKIIVSITGITIILLALVGLTYAYFLTQITGNENPKSISVTTANLSVTYNDDMDGDGEPDALMVFEKIEPSNTRTYTKTFKVENTGNATATYSVVLDNIKNEFERNQDLKYTLTRDGVEGNVAEGNLVVGTKQILLPKVEIENEGVHTYTLTLKYIETGTDQSIDMNKELSFRVNIENETVTWDTAEEGTLLYAIKRDNPVIYETEKLGTSEAPSTTYPGKTASLENEAIMASIEDDYGTSYYFRGNVTNNYVTFNNMCWRIVRVQGDGTIKLLLEDQTQSCEKIDYTNFNARNSVIAEGLPFNAPTYENSDIKKVVESWVNGGSSGAYFHNYSFLGWNEEPKNKLSNTNWCNDISIVNKYEFGLDYNDNKVFDKELAYDHSEGTGRYWYNGSDFGTYSRINNNENPSPTLKCNMRGIEDSKALRYESNIGILTVDEAVLAGFAEGDNSNNYINYKNLYVCMWTMSPESWSDIHEWDHHVYTICNSYDLEAYDYPFEGLWIRPVINLNSDIEINASGNGTQTSPYVVK